MNSNYIEILETAKKAAAAAAEIIISLQNKAKISEKGINNLVTEADIKSEAIIRQIILKAFPKHSILGEEGGGEDNMDAPHLWIIDPLDGTNNYAHGFPFFSTSIAYAENGKVKVGLVLDPTKNELFTAIEGEGAFLNGEKIKVSDKDLLSSLVSVGFYYDRGEMMRTTLKTIEKLFEHNIQGIRRTGSAAIDFCYVAAGRTDAYVEYFLSPWDFAAGMLILQEAGGVCKDAKGNTLSIKSKNIAVSNGTCTEEFLRIVKEPLTKLTEF
ncbi:MAG: inositol monophosphatase family protein [Spirochaetales bacterium]|nr:inositol monophosphatase family protein [Spirochaetales bacterium]